MAHILIAGCGDVGMTLGLDLAKAGHQVWGLRRNPSALPVGIHPLVADLADPASLRALPQALDYVFYTAAPDSFNEVSYQAVYQDGVHCLLTALQEAAQNPRRVFLTSSTSVYAQQQGEWVDEESPAEAAHFSARSIRAGEDLLWQGPYPATVIRFGGIYGPGRTRLLDSIRQGSATCVESLFTNRIHRDDAAAVLHHLLKVAEPAALYVGVDDQPAPQCQVMRWLARQLGVSEPLVTAAAGETEARMRANKRCRNTRLRASGFRFRYRDYQEGYKALLKNFAKIDESSNKPA
ncbi:MAG: SDR family oxidoreductase [Candidatus Competibacteraceae bacterium]|jgi:nucleoside-diphosphate-sugar epimerase|nr:SDR family oxidoreductase [Candidatus Competibacteraceae bacterium]